jgi:hypothetical protein
MRQVFATLPKPMKIGAFAIAASAALMAATAIPSFAHGSPSSPTGDCLWPLVNRLVVTRVSESECREAGGAVQRFAASILMAFFAAHFAVAWSEMQMWRASLNPSCVGAAGRTPPFGE